MNTSPSPPGKTQFTRGEDGAIRVSGTRVPLERVIFEWRKGASPEGIVESYPVLEPVDVYTAIAFYLLHTGEVDAYIRERADEAARVRRDAEQRFPTKGVRQRLLARLHR